VAAGGGAVSPNVYLNEVETRLILDLLDDQSMLGLHDYSEKEKEAFFTLRMKVNK
jgi:hypothetical protein